MLCVVVLSLCVHSPSASATHALKAEVCGAAARYMPDIGYGLGLSGTTMMSTVFPASSMLFTIR